MVQEQEILKNLIDYNNLVNARCLQITNCIEKGRRAHELKSMVSTFERDICLKWCAFIDAAKLEDTSSRELATLSEELESAIRKFTCNKLIINPINS